MIRVLVVDDDALVRTLLTTILAAQDLTVVAQAADGDEVVPAVQAHHPDVVLLDLHMPRMSGLDALAALRELPSPPGVIALTSFGTDETVVAAVRAGASGFLAKDADPAQIAEAVRRVADGDGALGRAAAGSLLRHVAADPDRGRREEAQRALEVLTEAELEVAAYVPAGLSNQAIGELTYRSDSTVKAHLSRAMAKLGVTTRSQLAVIVDRAGLRPG
ncbi:MULTISPECIES: response regulator transcription factor [unclassified Cellulomonas]|uniref:response regulator transcription factor n=1 Tax=unclassified Cellulomonas TaxID=2620175 RepID=UPI0019B13095|nr:response regulator transcription factor [Cellulomonas sp. ES6]MBD3778157.1 response regulator transcription factor [Micrococcales bacterium]WHP18950.1 response regulator transcription factor [Cellulomonas sp. ES6]